MINNIFSMVNLLLVARLCTFSIQDKYILCFVVKRITISVVKERHGILSTKTHKQRKISAYSLNLNR